MTPLVLTARVDQDTQDRWDALRTKWFPPERLLVGAHLTLFHALPGEHLPRVLADLREVLPQPFTALAGAPYSLGGGVALRVESAELLALHRELRRRWAPWLTRQDGQPLRPHVTVQNKVSADTARATLAALTAEWRPRRVQVLGVAVWDYLGGPWRARATVDCPDTR
ncbi:hypothetical protein JOF53_000753 [Crossiella equi]|uniref:2'-5' RNA ligase family protein n=1 Tax=Crossiella equi TaxID=130796 RepID=A0ABS5A5Q4_9PSEU|nr:2'-5' RNA ligase family protein [Crossiella equi]MBP2471881.1 hypothetical protein [Crossiella equi]